MKHYWCDYNKKKTDVICGKLSVNRVKDVRFKDPEKLLSFSSSWF